MRIKTNYILLVVFIIQLILGTIVSNVYNLGKSDYFVMFLTQLIPIFIPAFIYVLKKDGGYKRIAGKGINIAQIVTIIISSLSVNVVVNQFLCMPIYNLAYSEAGADNLVFIHYGFDFFIDIFIICVLPALFEELLFRGITLKEYENIYGSKKAIVMCALAFSLMHGTIVSLVPQFLIGLFLTYIVYKTSSLYAGIIGHFTINFTTLLLQRAAVDTNSFLRFVLSGNQFVVFIVFSGLLLTGVWGISNLSPKSVTFKKPSYSKSEIRIEKNFFMLLVILFVCIQLLSLIG